LADQIQACLEEGAKGEGKNTQDKNTPFDLWIRTGVVCIGEDKQFLTVVLCNDRIIKIAEPMLDKETFPYRLLIWERREDSWAGVGIPELMETPQRGLNAAVRALMDNMGYAVGPQILFRKGKIQPKEGDDWKLRAYKFWEMLEDSLSISPDSNNKPFELVEFPSYLDSILPIIQYWLKMAEDTTGLPLLLQGQTKQEAVGVNQQLMNNSTTNLRLIIKRWDDITCRPMIQDFYDWCQLYGPKETHGDATVEAIGSSTMLVKELQMQALLQIGDRILQPVYGKSPSKWMDAFLEGFQIDPASLELSDEERQQLEAAANQPDPSIMVAQIRSETDIAVENIRKASDEFKAILKAQADSLAVSQAREKVETESATEITKAAIQAEAKPAPQGQPSAPTLEAEPVDVDAALQTLGFVE
jgi:hypothetical protein